MKFTSVILFIFLLFASLPAYAQAAVNPEVQPQDSLSDAADAAEAEAAEEALLDELIMADSSVLEAEQQLGPVLYNQEELDRQLLEWALSWLDTTACTMVRDTIFTPDSVYQKRLSELPTIIPMTYNSVVRGFIEMYVKRRPRQVASLLRVAEFYFPIFEDKLCEYNLPDELKYLAVIESALNASARSHAGAAGLWQFMPSTGRNYGLEVNSLVDERLDPYKSTDAACRCLRALYKLYGDWHLALASYNCGPGNVNKAIRRSGGKRDFWSIYPWLPRETRAYVPIFIAANYAMYYSDEHGICPDTLYQTHLKHREVLMSAAVDTLHSSQRQHLEQISAVLGLPMAELRKLNPAYVRDVVPGGKDYNIVLPIDYAGAYIELQDSILAYKADSLLHKQAQMIAMAQKSTDTYSAGGITYYKVKKGDTLGAIAKRYRCSVKQLQRWNNLRSTNIQIGQKLKILK